VEAYRNFLGAKSAGSGWKMKDGGERVQGPREGCTLDSDESTRTKVENWLLDRLYWAKRLERQVGVSSTETKM
jgi:hypothetical protein